MCCTALPLCLISPPLQAQGTRADYERAEALGTRTQDTVFRERVSPHWMTGGNSFWYRNRLAEGKVECVIVDAVKGERRVVAEPPEQSGNGSAIPDIRPSSGERSPSTTLHFINRSGETARLFWIDPAGEWKGYGELKPGEDRLQHTYEGHVWVVRGARDRTLGVFEGQEETADAVIPPPSEAPHAAPPEAPPKPWVAFLRDHNIWVKKVDTGEETQLSHDGTGTFPYREPFNWSPDGSKLLAAQVEPEQERKVYLVESSPKDQLQPKLDSYHYLKPGDRIEHPHPRLFDVARGQAIPLKEDLFPNPWSLDVEWSSDGSRFYLVYAAVTTIAWTRSGGTRPGWAGRSGPSMRTTPTSPTRQISVATSC